MAIKQTIIEEITCDLCSKPMEETGCPDVSEFYSTAINKLEVTIYYGGTTKYEDICKSCNDKIIKTIKSLSEKNVI